MQDGIQNYMVVFRIYCFMGKKVIGLLGSPLSDGNTAKLLDRALKGAEDAGCTIEKIEVGSLDFQACQEMMFCKDHDTCIMDDDMQQLYPKFKEMDSLIIATPVMTMGIPGKLVHIKGTESGTQGIVHMYLRYEDPRGFCGCKTDRQGLF